MPAVEVDSLGVRYGDVVAVDGISFAAAEGAVTVVLGPNGAGKTSTLECLEGFRRPSSGTVRVCGFDPARDHTEVVRRIGVMLQDGGVYTGIRPPEAIRLFASYYDDPLDPEELLSMVGLEHRRSSSWRSLSGGEQQRLSLALALVGRPSVAFLDEPTAGVDLQGKQLIRSLIQDLRRDGVAIVLTTHDLEEAEMLADRIVIIDRGKVVADGTPHDLLATGEPEDFEFRAVAGLDMAQLGEALGATSVEESPGVYRIMARPTPDGVARLASWLATHDVLVGDLRAGRQRLDDLFARLTGEQSPVETQRAGSPRRRGAAS